MQPRLNMGPISLASMAKEVFVGSAIVRQWLILSLLPRAPHKVDAATIEARLQERGHTIHRRTIQRDLVELASVFPIMADERSKPYGWRWSDGAPNHAPPIPTHPEARRDAPRLRVKLRVDTRVSAEVAELLRLPIESSSAKGTTTLVAGLVDDTRRTRRVLLAYGSELEILEPARLRDELRALARSIAEALSR